MLYKILTLKVGDEKSDDLASRALSQWAKKGFVVQNATTAVSDDGIFSSYVLQRVPIAHLDRESNDPPGLNRIQLGDNVFYWDPCADDEDTVGGHG